MTKPHRDTIVAGRVERLRFEGEAGALSWADCLRGWRTEATFRARSGQALAALPFEAFRWECPPLTAGNLEQPFECVLIDAPELLREADGSDFAEHFEASAPVLRFANLGGDAELVVPRPMAEPAAYPHLGAFLRRAPAAQRDALWQAVAAAVDDCLGAAPVWLSTAGDGVPWLHVRLDSRPKYYRHAPYRRLA